MYFAPRYFGGYWGASYFGGGNPAPPDVVAACVARARATPAVVAAFGDSGATPKFFADKAEGQPALPYAVLGEPGATREYMAGGSWLDRGELAIAVYAAGKVLTRHLRDTLAAALNDAPLRVQHCAVIKARARGDSFVTTADVGPGVPTAYQGVLRLEYWIVGSI